MWVDFVTIDGWLSGVASRMHAARLGSGMSCEAAAGAAGVSEGLVYASETDPGSVTLRSLLRLCLAYGVAPLDVLRPPGGAEAFAMSLVEMTDIDPLLAVVILAWDGLTDSERSRILASCRDG